MCIQHFPSHTFLFAGNPLRASKLIKTRKTAAEKKKKEGGEFPGKNPYNSAVCTLLNSTAKAGLKKLQSILSRGKEDRDERCQLNFPRVRVGRERYSNKNDLCPSLRRRDMGDDLILLGRGLPRLLLAARHEPGIPGRALRATGKIVLLICRIFKYNFCQ